MSGASNVLVKGLAGNGGGDVGTVASSDVAEVRAPHFAVDVGIVGGQVEEDTGALKAPAPRTRAPTHMSVTPSRVSSAHRSSGAQTPVQMMPPGPAPPSSTSIARSASHKILRPPTMVATTNAAFNNHIGTTAVNPPMSGSSTHHLALSGVPLSMSNMSTTGGSHVAAGATAGAPLDLLGGASEVLARLKKLADEDRKELSKLQDAVWDSIGEHEVMEASFERQFETSKTIGEASADNVAAVGGSWQFVGGFFLFIAVWCTLNISLGSKAWDPYPFILLNLALSMLAAFQAPIIMMSQNRQASRDRMQSDYTARVNLRAELMTRHINAKLDALIGSAWRRLLEGQTVQTALLERMIENQRPTGTPTKATPTGVHTHTRTYTHSVSGTGSANIIGAKKAEEGGKKTDQVTSSAQPAARSGTLQRRDRALSVDQTQAHAHTHTTALVVYDEDTPSVDVGSGGVGVGGADTDTEPKEAEGSPERTSSQVSCTSSSSQALDPFSIPLAALCLAPPAARLIPGTPAPWLLETEEDDHTQFLLRAMLNVEDEANQLMVFEHRLASMGDNFYGRVSHVRLEARDPSLLSKAVPLCLPPSTHAPTPTTTLDFYRGRTVSTSFVTYAVAVASLVDTGGGAECVCPFDLVYDLTFSEGAVLDSIFAGDGMVSLRNATDLSYMTAPGQIRRMVLHPRGCPCTNLDVGGGEPGLLRGGASFCDRLPVCTHAVEVINGEVPPRFKPSVSKDRKDRISDFWKTPLARIEVSYSPAEIFACVTLRDGQVAAPLAVEFVNITAEQLMQQQPQAFRFPPSLDTILPKQPLRAGSASTIDNLLSRQASARGVLSTSGSAGAAAFGALGGSGIGGGLVKPQISSSSGSSYAADASHAPTQTPPHPHTPELVCIINPSAEMLCRALALGFAPSSDTHAHTHTPHTCASDSDTHLKGMCPEVPLRIDANDAKWSDTGSPAILPHNAWLALPLVKDEAGEWLVEMPGEVSGPAALFFYSPDGRLRLKGFLRDDGHHPYEDEEDEEGDEEGVDAHKGEEGEAPTE